MNLSFSDFPELLTHLILKTWQYSSTKTFDGANKGFCPPSPFLFTWSYNHAAINTEGQNNQLGERINSD